MNQLNRRPEATHNVAHLPRNNALEAFLIPTEAKALMASACTVCLSVLVKLADTANAAAVNYMPLVTAFSLVAGVFLTAFYYSYLVWAKHQDMKNKARERRLEHLRREHEARMAGLGNDDGTQD